MSEQPVAAKLGSFAKATKLTSVVLTALLLASCGNVIQVTRQKVPVPPAPATTCVSGADNCKLPGIPFYAVGYRCTHSTSWLRPLYVITVVVSKDEKDGEAVKAVTRVLGMQGLQQAGDIIAEIKNAGSVTQPKYECLLKSLTAVPESDLSTCETVLNPITCKPNTCKPSTCETPPTPSTCETCSPHDVIGTKFNPVHLPNENSCEAKSAVLASNRVDPERYVDAQAVYFQNVKRPWTGSANTAIDLSAEGILSKSSATIDDRTLEAILTTIGSLGGAAMTAAFTTTTQAPAIPGTKGATEAKFKLDLQIQTKLYRYTLSAPQCMNLGTDPKTYTIGACPNEASRYALPPCNPTSTIVGGNHEQLNSTFEEITIGATPGDDAQKPGKKPATETK